MGPAHASVVNHTTRPLCIITFNKADILNKTYHTMYAVEPSQTVLVEANPDPIGLKVGVIYDINLEKFEFSFNKFICKNDGVLNITEISGDDVSYYGYRDDAILQGKGKLRETDKIPFQLAIDITSGNLGHLDASGVYRKEADTPQDPAHNKAPASSATSSATASSLSTNNNNNKPNNPNRSAEALEAVSMPAQAKWETELRRVKDEARKSAETELEARMAQERSDQASRRKAEQERNSSSGSPSAVVASSGARPVKSVAESSAPNATTNMSTTATAAIATEIPFSNLKSSNQEEEGGKLVPKIRKKKHVQIAEDLNNSHNNSHNNSNSSGNNNPHDARIPDHTSDTCTRPASSSVAGSAAVSSAGVAGQGTTGGSAAVKSARQKNNKIITAATDKPASQSTAPVSNSAGYVVGGQIGVNEALANKPTMNSNRNSNGVHGKHQAHNHNQDGGDDEDEYEEEEEVEEDNHATDSGPGPAGVKATCSCSVM